MSFKHGGMSLPLVLGKSQFRSVSLDSRGNKNLNVFGSGTVIKCTTCSQIGQNKTQTRETQKKNISPKQLEGYP